MGKDNFVFEIKIRIRPVRGIGPTQFAATRTVDRPVSMARPPPRAAVAIKSSMMTQNNPKPSGRATYCARDPKQREGDLPIRRLYRRSFTRCATVDMPNRSFGNWCKTIRSLLQPKPRIHVHAAGVMIVAILAFFTNIVSSMPKRMGTRCSGRSSLISCGSRRNSPPSTTISTCTASAPSPIKN